MSIFIGAIKGVQNKKKAEVNGKVVSKKDLKNVIDKPIDELVNFIEGNKATNEKRAAKKLRRREKKVYILNNKRIIKYNVFNKILVI